MCEKLDSQKYGMIRLLYKKEEMLLLKNWRPISLLNTDYSGALAREARLQSTMGK